MKSTVLHWRRAVALALACVAVLAIASPVEAASSATKAGSQAIFTATNDYRADHGRAALKRDGGIDSVAQRWAARMLERDELEHNPQFSDQMPQSGLRGGGENIAYACGYGGVNANTIVMMRGWRASPGHSRNMLRPSYTHIGIGFAYDSASDCAFAVQDFGAYTGTFVDVPASHQFSTQIEWLVGQGITTGYADGRFKPRAPVTRAAFAAFLYRMAGEPSFTPPENSPFVDYRPGDQFYTEVSWLAKQGITTGYADGTFRPHADISREAIAAFLYRSAGSPAVTMPQASPFTDVKLRDQFAREIVWLSRSGITTGYADGTFRPGADVTREATAAFLYRLP